MNPPDFGSSARSPRWLVLGFVFAGILISYVDRGNLSIAATSLMHDFQIPPASMGILLSAFFWTYAIFQLPAGALVDRFGLRSTYAAAFAIWSVASAAVALSRGFSDVLALRMLLGFAESVGPLASLAFIRQNFAGPEQGLPVSLYISGQTLGPAFGTLLGSMLLARFGWRVLFAATGLAALFWIPGWLAFAPRTPSVSKIQTAPPIDWRRILTHRAFWIMPACIFFMSYYWYFVLTWMPAYLTMARGYSTLGMGALLSTPLFLMAGINVVAGVMADRLARTRTSIFGVRIAFAVAGLLGSSLILLLNIVPERKYVLPILIASVCSFGLASSNYWAISQHTPPAHMVGRAIGLLNTMSQIAGALAPLITGWSLGPQKHFGFAILLAGVSPLAACVLLLTAGSAGLENVKRTLAS